MAKITDFAIVDAITGDEFLPIVQGGQTKRSTMTALRALLVPFLQNWYKGDRGDRGPNGYAAISLAQLRAAPVGDGPLSFDGAVWSFVAGDASQAIDDRYAVASNHVAPAQGAWRRQGADTIAYAQRGGRRRPLEDAVRSHLPDALDFVPAAHHAAILDGTSTYDATADLQAAIDLHNGLRLPRGVLRIDAAIGLKVRSGTRIEGRGWNQSVLYALPGGGTIDHLAGYERGSVLRRAFDPAGPNPYVVCVSLSDFGIVLNHAFNTISADAIQIGFDMRNVTRSMLQRLYCGNFAPIGGPLVRERPANENLEIQGYNYVFGNVSAGDPAYAGGEVNTMRDCLSWQAYRLVTIDDDRLSPVSAAYKTTVADCDLQGGHDAIVQHGKYGALNLFRGNTIQNIVRQPGNAAPTHIYRIDGYNTSIDPGYIEGGQGPDYIVRLGPESRANMVRPGGYTTKNPLVKIIDDAGQFNEVHWWESAGIDPQYVDSSGKPLSSYNQVISPGRSSSMLLTGDGQVIPCNDTHLTVIGGSAERTGITVAAQRHIGQRLTLTNNSTAFTFAANANVVWGAAGPAQMGNGAGQVMSLDLVATQSGWYEVGRTVRAG